MHLDVRQRESRTFAFETLDQRRGQIAEPPVVPASHQAIEERPPGERPREARVEERVRVTGTHPLPVEPVAEALPQRERIEADPAVEPCIAAPPDAPR